MVKFNVYDVCEIQESLESYLKLLEWIPACGEEESAMREARISYVKYLVDKCDKVLNSEKIWSVYDEQSDN